LNVVAQHKQYPIGNYIESGQPFCVYKLHLAWSRPIYVIGKKRICAVFFFSNYIESGYGPYLCMAKKKVDHS